jgi:hypothetical protein
MLLIVECVDVVERGLGDVEEIKRLDVDVEGEARRVFFLVVEEGRLRFNELGVAAGTL